MKLKFMGASLVLLLNVYVLTAQIKHSDANLTGHVIDRETKQHLPYVSIGLKGTTISSTTDATGHFFLRNLPIGEHTLVASYIGYEGAELNIKIEPNKTIEANFDLKAQSMEMDEVVVTSSRNETSRKKAASIVNVIPSRLFEATASSCAAEVLSFQSGLRVEATCGNCSAPELRINGLGGQYSQILLDSRPIFSSLAGVYGLEQLPTSMIERIEVIRGGGSALFGSSAIGGVVNIITKEPARNMLALSNSTGIYGNGKVENNTTVNGAFVTDDRKVGVHVFGTVKSKDAYDHNDDGFSDSPKLNSETIGFRGYYRTSYYSKITAEYHHIREFRRGGDKFDRPPHEADIAEQLRHTINGGGLKFDISSKDYKHRVSLYASAQKIDRESYFGTRQDLNAYGSTDDFTFIGGGQYTYSFDKLLFMPSDFIFGAEYTSNFLKDEMLGYDKELDQHSTCYGSFFQNEWKNDRLSLLLGGRLDKHNKIDNVVFTPRANVRYSPVKEVGLRISYSSGYRAPQAYDEDLHVEAVGGNVSIITISPDLKPEYSNSLSTSVDLYQSFGSIQANLLIEGFYTAIKDVFTLEPNGVDADGNQIWERRNGSGAAVKGVNLEMRVGLPARITVDAGYTIQNSRYKEPLKWSDNPDITPGKRMFRAPNQYGYFTLSYNPLKQLSLSLSGSYTGSMLVQHMAGYIAADEEKETPTFFEAGVRMAYDFSLSSQVTLQISGGVKNIFDRYQKDLDVGILKDAGYIYGPAMPRLVHFGVKLMM